MDLGIQLGRDESAASYLREHVAELPLGEHADAVLAALETGMALERSQFGLARRQWRRVLAAAEQLGRQARSDGIPLQRVVVTVDRVREALDLVLFDGRLPTDIAAQASRMASKMSAHVVRVALLEYWADPSSREPVCGFQVQAQ